MTISKVEGKNPVERNEAQAGSRIYSKAKAFFAALRSFVGAAGLSAGSAWAGSAVSETVLCSFCQQTKCADGEFPSAGLIATNQGGLYGTTELGGMSNDGVAFLLAPNGSYNVLHVFRAAQWMGLRPWRPSSWTRERQFLWDDLIRWRIRTRDDI
jgi:uncharacterized repeat protein (TIGR03803 family)